MEQQSYQLFLAMSPLERRRSAAAPENMVRFPSQAKMNQEICNFWPLKATDMGERGQKKKSNQYQVTYIFFRFFSHVFQA